MNVSHALTLRGYLTALLAALFLLASSTSAFAGTATSSPATFSISGKTYSVTSTVTTRTGTDIALSRNASLSGGVSAGHMGVIARAYRSDSTGSVLIASSGYAYNPSSGATAITTTVDFTGTSGRSYFSKGVAKGYSTATGVYATKTSNGSPNQNA